MMQRTRGLLVVAAAIGLLFAPLALLLWLQVRSDHRLTALEPGPVPVIAVMESRTFSGDRAVWLGVEWGSPDVLVAPQWSGTTTDVVVDEGEELVSGAPVLVIDGVERILGATPSPFWRELRRGDRGEDVAALERLLTEWGWYAEAVDGVFDQRLAAAVDAFGRSIGVDRPGGVFQPSWLVWAPVEGFEVGDVSVRPGEPAPPAGQVLLEGKAPIIQVIARDAQGLPLDLAGQWVLTVGGVDVDVTDGAIPADALARLGQVLDAGVTEAQGRVRLAQPLEVVEVPAPAVASSSDGRLCVWIPSGDGFEPRAIVTASGRPTGVNVVEGVAHGDAVLLNPTDILDDPLCP